MKTIDQLSREASVGFDATHTLINGLADKTKRGFDATHALLGEHDRKVAVGFDATHALLAEHDGKEDARKTEVIQEIRKNSANPKKSGWLLLLVIVAGIALAAGSYWFVICSDLCHLGGLWMLVPVRDAIGNIITGSFDYALVEGAEVIWGALSVAMGAAVAALLHAVIPWYRKEV